MDQLVINTKAGWARLTLHRPSVMKPLPEKPRAGFTGT
jgi:hypothetical protein